MMNEYHINSITKTFYLSSFILGVIGLIVYFMGIGNSLLLFIGLDFLLLGFGIDYGYSTIISYRKERGVEDTTISLKEFMKFALIITFVFLLIGFGVKTVNGDNPRSAIIENQNNYQVKCFHNNNIITLYDKEDNKIFEGRCFNEYQRFGKELFSNVEKIEIKNPSNVTDRYIRYTESLKESKKKEYDVKKESFDNKYCFTVETRVYSDIKIQNEEFTQVKEAYHCLKKTDVEGVVEIKLDDKLIKTYNVKKKDNDISINLEKKGQVNENYKDKVKVTFSKDTNNVKRITVLDTNMKCAKDDFQLGEQYSMTCNVTHLIKNEDLIYYMQIRDNNRNTFYKEEEFRLMDRENNFWLEHIRAIVVLTIIIIVSLWSYNRRVNKNKKVASDELDEDEE